MKEVEYKVREIKRYIVTRWESEIHENGNESGGSQGLGEYDNPDDANTVAIALQTVEGGESKLTLWGAQKAS